MQASDIERDVHPLRLGISSVSYDEEEYNGVFLAVINSKDRFLRVVVMPSLYLSYAIFSTNTRSSLLAEIEDILVIEDSILPDYLIDQEAASVYLSVSGTTLSELQGFLAAEEPLLDILSRLKSSIEGVTYAGSESTVDLESVAMAALEQALVTLKVEVTIPSGEEEEELPEFTYSLCRPTRYVPYLKELVASLRLSTSSLKAATTLDSASYFLAQTIISEEVFNYIDYGPLEGDESWQLDGVEALGPENYEALKTGMKAFCGFDPLKLLDTIKSEAELFIAGDVLVIDLENTAAVTIPRIILSDRDTQTFDNVRLYAELGHIISTPNISETNIDVEITYLNRRRFQQIPDGVFYGTVEPRVLELVTDIPALEEIKNALEELEIQYAMSEHEPDTIVTSGCIIRVYSDIKHDMNRYFGSCIPQSRGYLSKDGLVLTATAVQAFLGGSVLLYPSPDLAEALFVTGIGRIYPKLSYSCQNVGVELIQDLDGNVDYTSLFDNLKAREVDSSSSSPVVYDVMQ